MLLPPLPSNTPADSLLLTVKPVGWCHPAHHPFHIPPTRILIADRTFLPVEDVPPDTPLITDTYQEAMVLWNTGFTRVGSVEFGEPSNWWLQRLCYQLTFNGYVSKHPRPNHLPHVTDHPEFQIGAGTTARGTLPMSGRLTTVKPHIHSQPSLWGPTPDPVTGELRTVAAADFDQFEWKVASAVVGEPSAAAINPYDRWGKKDVLPALFGSRQPQHQQLRAEWETLWEGFYRLPTPTVLQWAAAQLFHNRIRLIRERVELYRMQVWLPRYDELLVAVPEHGTDVDQQSRLLADLMRFEWGAVDFTAKPSLNKPGSTQRHHIVSPSDPGNPQDLSHSTADNNSEKEGFSL